MKREAALIVTTLFGLAAAGCVAPPEELGSAVAELDSPLLASLGALTSAATTAEDAIVLRVNATPEGGLAAFWWTIPPGLVPDAKADASGGDGEARSGSAEEDEETEAYFLVAPVLLEEDRAALEQWTLMAFLAEEGELQLNSLAFGAPMTVSGGGVFGSGGEDIERSIEPFHFSVDGELRTGGRLGFVIGGIASEPVELALVLKPLAKEPSDDDEAPESTEEFLAALGQAPRVALTGKSVEALHQVAIYVDGSSLFGGFTFQTGPVSVDGGRAGPLSVGATRHQTISTSFESAGYALNAAGYDTTGSAGAWDVVADAHGVVAESGGTMATAFGMGPSGAPWVVAIGEGSEPSSLSLTIDSTSAAFYEGVYLVNFDLGATLSDLLGLPSMSVKQASEGGMMQLGRDLVLDVGGARAIVPNLF